MSSDVSNEVRSESEKNVQGVIRNFLIGNRDEALKALAAISNVDVKRIYEETERIVNAHKIHEAINKLPVIVSCPKCNTAFFLDSDIEEEFVENEGKVLGSFACPNCNALSKYDFTEGKIAGTVERSLFENLFLGFNVNTLRKRIEELLIPLYGEVIKFGESKHSVITIPMSDKCRVILRHAAKKRSDEEKWETKWNSRFKADINNSYICNLSGEINFDSKRDSVSGPILFSKSLTFEKSYVLPKENLENFVHSLANLFSEATKEAVLNVLGLLEQAPLVLEWMRPLKRLAAFEPSAEKIPFVSELERKIKERKEKKEREPERI